MEITRQNKSSLLRQSQNVWRTLARIQTIMDLSDQELAESLSLPLKKLLRLRESNTAPSIVSLVPFLESLNLSLSHIISGKIDYEVLFSHVKGKLDVLPERYTQVAFSKCRTSLALLNHLEFVVGSQFRQQLLKELQIYEAALLSPDASVNIRLYWDICNMIHRRGFSDQFIYHMGTFAVVSNMHSPVAEYIGAFSNPRAVYENLPAILVGYFEKNHNYWVDKFTQNSCVIRSHTHQEVSEGLKLRHVGSRAMCLARLGVSGSFTGYLGLPLAKASQRRCVHEGDPYCEFEVDFEEANFMRQSSRYGSHYLNHLK